MRPARSRTPSYSSCRTTSRSGLAVKGWMSASTHRCVGVALPAGKGGFGWQRWLAGRARSRQVPSSPSRSGRPICCWPALGLGAWVLPREVRLDGRDPLPALTEGARSPHGSFYFEYRSHIALRRGDWKIVRERPDQPWRLFNLARDLSELFNLAAADPGRVAELEAELRRWKASF